MNEIKKPDLNAPRFRKTSCNTLTIDFIKGFRIKFPQYENLSDNQIKEIIHSFNENIWKTTIKKRDGVELPLQIGHMFIGTCPPPKRRYNMDMKTSLEYMQKIKHRNWESDQYLAKIFYTNAASKYRFQFSNLWLKPLLGMKKLYVKEVLIANANYVQNQNLLYTELGYGLDGVFKIFRLEGIASFTNGQFNYIGFRVNINSRIRIGNILE
jgi:hypothetical protein